ncbi:Lectin receptor kinase [Quillaja saponaria]|uniref:Lectin receptor kinase n=1 Tax=Quillaja saponaria TaxID=32244 RepID=A0AAD7L8U5_QUISA|nr:Lectin receptor kinase [Quillaja saponaria]
MGTRLSFSFTTVTTTVIIAILLHFPASISQAQNLKKSDKEFGPFDHSYFSIFHVIPNASINNKALQITPDSAGDFTFTNNSGRIFWNEAFTLWEDGKVASFNSSFLVNVFRLNNDSVPGEGLAFLIAPEMDIPLNSHGEYLGLTNATTDGDTNNHLVAIELDTFKQDFDPDDNHIGLDINSIRSKKNVSLSQFGIQISPVGTKFYVVWVEYDGARKVLDIYMAEQHDKDAPIVRRPTTPVLSSNLDLRTIVKQQSYFGFAASTGDNTQLNCVLKWNITVELLSEESKTGHLLSIALGVGIPVVVLGTGGEFSFKDLKKATNNFDDKHKLGQGGFGVVYRGLLPKENLEIAVKKFSRDNIKGKDDFLSELTIINRLRHKHLVRLLGWCHKNGMLLLVYDYMPNGSLDNHLFFEPGTTEMTLSWHLRYKIITGVASALHYLHNEYDQKVVHRDLKASNIMLDADFNARLGDFGLARALENEKTSYAELEGMPGTVGYIAPECFHTGKATRVSDVYGFGAVLLEVVCGQRPWTKNEGFQCLVDWVWCLHREGRILEAVDNRLGNDYVVEEAERLLLLGLACSHPIASERPKTQTIGQIISGSVPVPHVPPFKPPFIWSSLPDWNFDSDLLSTTTTDVTPINTNSSLQFGHSNSSLV